MVMTPEKRSENARRAALVGAQKRKNKLIEKKKEDFNFAIRYDIPVPERCEHRNSNVYNFLDTVKPDGSFFIQDEKLYRKFYQALGAYGKKFNKSFVGRRFENGYGIWRIK